MNSKKLLTDSKTEDIIEKIKNLPVPQTQKFTEEEKLFIVDRIARCYTYPEIRQDVQERFKKNLYPYSFYAYRDAKKWRPVIAKLREEYNINVPAATFSSKRSRLDMIERIYNRAVERDDLSVQAKLASQAWREMEGAKKDGDTTNVYWNNPVYQQMNLKSTEELMRLKEIATTKLREQRILEENCGPDRPSE